MWRTTEASFRIGRLPTGIRTQHLPNSGLEPYRYDNLLVHFLFLVSSVFFLSRDKPVLQFLPGMQPRRTVKTQGSEAS
jgi:hypothetical protein